MAWRTYVDPPMHSRITTHDEYIGQHDMASIGYTYSDLETDKIF